MRSLDAVYLGDPTEEPIIFLHGFGTPPTRYLPLLERLGAHYQVIAPNLKGDDLATSATRVQELASHLHLPHYHIVAHSAGAGTAFRTAIHDPRVIDIASLSGVLPGARSFARLATGVAQLAHGKIEREENRHLSTLAQRSAEITQSIWYDLRGHARLMRDLMHFQIGDDEIRQPVLIATSQNDPFFPLTPRAQQAVYDACYDPRIIEVPNADHEWPWLQPERAYALVLQFYDEIKQTSTKKRRTR